MQGGGGCWTSPGEHDICECLGSGEEGKDDPVHHPLHLKVQRAVLAGALGKHPGPHLYLPTMLEALWGGAQRAPILSVYHTRAGEREYTGASPEPGLISADSISIKSSPSVM